MSVTELTPRQWIERRHDYFWPDGQPAFSKVRYAPTKAFRTGQFFGQRFVPMGKPSTRYLVKYGEVRATSLLYDLPALLAGIREGRPVFLCEGEKDADSVTATGRLATSAQNGAEHFGPAEAAWLAGARTVIVLMDVDPSGVGDALRKVDILAKLDPAPEVVVFSAATGKDVSDHLAADLPLREMVHVPVSWLRANAPRVTPADRVRAGYRAVLKAVRA